MPLDPKFETSAGLQRFREQIFRENRSRLFCGSQNHLSDAAKQFLQQRKQQIQAEQKTAMGARGTAGRSGVVSATQRNCLDEGYDVVLKTEWGAATEGVSAEDPVFRELNAGTIGASARTLHVQREESARAVSETRQRMVADKQSTIDFVHKAHQMVEDGWVRARENGLSASRTSQVNRSDLSTVRTMDHLYSKPAPDAAALSHHNRGIDNETASSSAAAAATHDFSSVGDGMQRKKGIGLASAGVRAPTFTAERHAELTRRVRNVFEPPPPPPRDVFAALEHVTKMSLPKRDREPVHIERVAEERADRKELQQRVDRLQKQLEKERDATVSMSSKLEKLKDIAANDE